MTTQDNDRTETARRHDDRDLIENADKMPGGAGSSGGTLARDIGSRDDAVRTLDPSAGTTRVENKDKVQPVIPTRADNEGANG
jgi:hypothetical protein